MAGRSIFVVLSIVLVAGGLLLQLFTILSGAVNHSPIDKFYFLQATTRGIPDARDPSRWTFFAICGQDPDTDRNANCGNVVPALPFDPPRNFGTQTGVPQQFIGTHMYYLLSRFMFAFYLIALVFAFLALASSMFACCGRLGGYAAAFTTSIAMFFQALGSALMTAWVIKGRDAFRKAGDDAEVGKYLMGFAWASTFAFLLACIFFCSGWRSSRHESHVRRGGSKRSSHHSRGSFHENGVRGVKDNYS